jgi:hypothetical protein
VRGVEHVQAHVPVAERQPEDLGRQARATHSQQHGVGDAVVAHLGRERAQVLDLRRHPLRDVEPAQAVGQLRRARRCPQRAVALPDAAGDLLVRRRGHALAHTGLEVGWQLALDGGHGGLPYPFYMSKGSGVSR